VVEPGRLEFQWVAFIGDKAAAQPAVDRIRAQETCSIGLLLRTMSICSFWTLNPCPITFKGFPMHFRNFTIVFTVSDETKEFVVLNRWTRSCVWVELSFLFLGRSEFIVSEWRWVYWRKRLGLIQVSAWTIKQNSLQIYLMEYLEIVHLVFWEAWSWWSNHTWVWNCYGVRSVQI